jgi:hypothetical protein
VTLVCGRCGATVPLTPTLELVRDPHCMGCFAPLVREQS